MIGKRLHCGKILLEISIHLDRLNKQFQKCNLKTKYSHAFKYIFEHTTHFVFKNG